MEGNERTVSDLTNLNGGPAPHTSNTNESVKTDMKGNNKNNSKAHPRRG
jgi:hypothetical protein